MKQKVRDNQSRTRDVRRVGGGPPPDAAAPAAKKQRTSEAASSSSSAPPVAPAAAAVVAIEDDEPPAGEARRAARARRRRRRRRRARAKVAGRGGREVTMCVLEMREAAAGAVDVYGVSRDGESLLLRAHNFRNHFFVAAQPRIPMTAPQAVGLFYRRCR